MKISPFTKTSGGRLLLEFPGMELEPGRIYCVIGANGSGKSTLARLLSGVLAADGNVRPLPEGVRVGCMPQRSYAFRMGVRANILLSGGNEMRAQALMQALGIDHLANRRADRLSGGETARMALARILMPRFDLLILDEPTAAMDVETTLQAEACIRRCVAETGCALLLITHSLRQARRLADEILFLHEGRLLESGPAEPLLESPARPETRRFLDLYGA